MTSILYYSNFCEHSKKLLQVLSKTQVSKNIHFICIDKRVKEKDGKTYIVLENGQKIILPENVIKVPALLLLNDNFKVLYGEAIQDHLKPIQEVATVVATQNNMEPSAFSLGGGCGGGYGSFGGVVSDNFSFLDMNSDSLTAKGDGGLRQMHQYAGLYDTGGGNGHNTSIQTPADDYNYKQNKIPEGLTVEQLQKTRETEFLNLSANNKR